MINFLYSIIQNDLSGEMEDHIIKLVLKVYICIYRAMDESYGLIRTFSWKRADSIEVQNL